jgi:hypothetical protein
MPRSSVPAKQKRKPWSKDDLALLRKLAKDGVTGSAIAKKLKRTKAAIYQRAAMKGISLGGKRSRRPKKKK